MCRKWNSSSHGARNTILAGLLLLCCLLPCFSSDAGLPDPAEMSDLQILNELSATWSQQDQQSALQLEKLEKALQLLEKSQPKLEKQQQSLDQLLKDLQAIQAGLNGSSDSLRSFIDDTGRTLRSLKTQNYWLKAGMLGLLAMTAAGMVWMAFK